MSILHIFLVHGLFFFYFFFSFLYKTGPTPAVDDAQLRAGIAAFEWDIGKYFEKSLFLYVCIVCTGGINIDIMLILF